MKRFALIASVAGLTLAWILATDVNVALAPVPEAFESFIKAAKDADRVIVAKVLASRDHRATDGGVGYELRVQQTWKGTSSENLSIRAGGWAYNLDLPIGSEVLLYLEENSAFGPAEVFVPTLGPAGRPLAFSIRGEDLVRIDPLAPSASQRWALEPVRKAILSVEAE